MWTPSPSSMVLIPPGSLQKICTHLKPERAAILEKLFNGICPTYGIDTTDKLQEFLANVIEECIEFTSFTESLYYTNAEHIQQTWHTRFPTVADALPYVKNPKGLAMKVYGSRKDLGNITAEDGWDFRGSGPIQLTGRSNIVAFANFMQKKFGIAKTLREWAELLRTEDEAGIHSACWLFAISKELIDEAINDDMKTICKRINGGLNGYATRIHYYELVKKYIP